MLKKIDCVAIPIRRGEVEKSIAFYSSLGLTKSWELKREIENDVVWTLVGMRFPDGETELVLQDHPDIRTLDIELRVDDVFDAYERLRENPDVEWIREPFSYRDGCAVAVFKAPDGNLFVLISG